LIGHFFIAVEEAVLVPAEVVLGYELVDVQDTIWVLCLILTGH
jgi:hypothetical protein